MYKQGIEKFKYYVGMRSLSDIATREDRVCVLNILGAESSEVTPVGHAYSGGNVVFGTSPGRGGQVLATPVGNIPVYNNVLEGIADGHRFNCGVVYLPPSGARDGVAELIRLNSELKKIFIVTEKISVHDAREIRAMGQINGIDIFGANCLGVADSWNRVRIGGALGGDAPEDVLRKGSIAILSNSGGFTTTIAAYLRLMGWGTTTLVSSGKDVYIHYAAPEFAYALSTDERSKAAVLYVEPGGFYEKDADFTKPVIACVVGRWKSKLTRAVGHAGAMSGGSDDAESKECWFMEKFGVDGIYTPERPIFSAKGAVVTNIAHIASALTAVMRQNDTQSDFPPEGNMALKPWFGSNQGLRLPVDLDVAVATASAPYDRQIFELNKQLGAVFPRQALKDASGASQMDAKTQISFLHGVSVLDAAQYSVEANICLALLRTPGTEPECGLISLAVASQINLYGDPVLSAVDAARSAGNAPNSVLATACSILGPGRSERAKAISLRLMEVFARTPLRNGFDETCAFDQIVVDSQLRRLVVTERPDEQAEAMLSALEARASKPVFVRFLQTLGGSLTADAVLAAITTSIAWEPLSQKRISRLTVASLPWWIRLFGVMIGASVDPARHKKDEFCGFRQKDMLDRLSLGEICYVALLGNTPSSENLFAFQALIGLLLTNGPGTISAQGAKGAVSADGPENPERVQLNKAMVGFLTHSGFTHGGNGYEGIKFLIEQFQDTGMLDPTDPRHGIDLEKLAGEYVRKYGLYKADKKLLGDADISKIPGVNHPVFKGQPVNYDPRERHLKQLLDQRGDYNVFHEYYHELVKALFEQGLSRNVYCVNIDAVIAALLLKILWHSYRGGLLTEAAIENAAFTAFLYARMIGGAAEIDDHLNRGRNMDTRTPASQCQFVC
ncbi:CoA-binding protein [Noviherbaspirillum saxi]|uniref:CoA-binding protein n=1 Tax=Noviherbaspirillum saxi TaxID=2320863 RepID=A0A3A3G3X1_9BURK|nr:CoA-binding protein [Noviherbaspirillum saxi]RJF92763.1 CoA-binding protein [Noviherbaspirillum saxi]